MATSVFLVDDHEVVRRGIRDLLAATADLEVCGEAASVDEALRRIPATRPEVAVLDVRLPDGSGVELCREIRARQPEIRCLMLTSFADDEALLQATLAGAHGYILKQVRAGALLAAIREVAAGRSLLDPARAGQIVERLRHPAAEDPALSHLTGQERAVLAHLAEGLTNRQIADEMGLSDKTVKNYVSNVLAKLGVARRTEAAVVAVRSGLATSRGPTGAGT